MQPTALAVTPPDRPRRRMPQVDDAWRHRIEEALHANGGNVTAAARALGLHRTQMRRLIKRHAITISAIADTERDDEAAT